MSPKDSPTEAWGDDEEKETNTAWIDTHWFGVCMGTVVCVNLVTVGLETDLRTGSWPQLFSTINSFFLLAYVSELTLRFHAHGLVALQDRLTLLEIVLVAGPMIERISFNSGFVRALSAFRLLRVARKLGTSSFLKGSKILPVLLALASPAMSAVAWVCLLAIVMVWGMASFSEYVLGESGEWIGSLDPLVEHEPFVSFDNREYFGSVSRSFLTLLQVVTLSQWGDVVRRVLHVYPYLVVFFVSFVLLTAYGLVQSIVGVVAAASFAQAEKRRGANEDKEKEFRQNLGDKVRAIFADIDKDCDGLVTVNEVREGLEDYNLVPLFKRLEVPEMTAEQISCLGDITGEGKVHYNDFVERIVAMDDDVKTRDYIRLLMWMTNLLKRSEKLSDRVTQLAKQTIEIRKVFQKAFSSINYFHENREVTELKNRAVKTVRSAVPDDPPRLKGWKPPPDPKYPPESEEKVFLTFMRRLMGGRDDTDDAQQSSSTHIPGGQAVAASAIELLQVGPDITQDVIFCGEEAKSKTVIGLLESRSHARAIVFVADKHVGRELNRRIDRSLPGICRSIDNDRSEAEKEGVQAQFRRNEIRVLVTTDEAGRNLDISKVDLLVNVDPPNSEQDYVRRVLRMLRAGAKGEVISVLSHRDSDAASFIIEVCQRGDVPASGTDLPGQIEGAAPLHGPYADRRGSLGEAPTTRPQFLGPHQDPNKDDQYWVTMNSVRSPGGRVADVPGPSTGIRQFRRDIATAGFASRTGQ